MSANAIGSTHQVKPLKRRSEKLMFHEFIKLLEKKHDTVQDEIKAALYDQKHSATTDDVREAKIRELTANGRLLLINWCIAEANKVKCSM